MTEPTASPAAAPLTRVALRNRLIFTLLVYAEIFLFCSIAGYRFQIPWHYFQILSPNLFADRFLESIWHLHSQPPMLNIVLGAAMKLEMATGIRPQTWLLGFHFLLGAEIVASFVFLTERFLPGRRRKIVALAILVLHPCFYMFLFHYFYTIHELAILAPMAVFALRFFERSRVRDYAALCALAVLMCYTRSLFHFIGWIAALAAIARPAIRGGASEGTPRKLALCLALSIAAILFWPAKNSALFGVFSYSSWQGLNLSSSLEVSENPPHDESIPLEYMMIPALALDEKSQSSVNWNYYPMIALSKVRQREAMDIILKHPWQLARKAAWNYWNLTRFTGRSPYDAFYGIDTDVPVWALPWMALYERATLLDFRTEPQLRARDLVHRKPEGLKLSWFMLVMPIILWLSMELTRMHWKRDPARARTAAFMLFCCIWVLLMALVVDGTEGNRMRFSTEPFLILLAFWLIPECSPLQARPISRAIRDHPEDSAMDPIEHGMRWNSVLEQLQDAQADPPACPFCGSGALHYRCYPWPDDATSGTLFIDCLGCQRIFRGTAVLQEGARLRYPENPTDPSRVPDP